MNVKLKLYAQLGQYLPENAVANEAELKLDQVTTVQQLLDRYGVPEEMCHLVLINGVYVEPSARSSRQLDEADHLAVWPPVAGG